MRVIEFRVISIRNVPNESIRCDKWNINIQVMCTQRQMFNL